MTHSGKFIAIVLSSALLLAVMVSSAVCDTVINVPLKIQEHSNWCWDASSQAVLKYYGQTVSQCEIANWAWGRSDCCGNSTFDWSHACNNENYVYGTSGSVQNILSHWGVSSDALPYAISAAGCVAEINARRPFLITFAWTFGGGHMVDGYGYDLNGQYLDYMDPLPGHGYTKSLYSWVVQSSYHTWTHTLTLTTPPPSGGVSYDVPLYPFYDVEGGCGPGVVTTNSGVCGAIGYVASSPFPESVPLYPTYDVEGGCGTAVVPANSGMCGVIGYAAASTPFPGSVPLYPFYDVEGGCGPGVVTTNSGMCGVIGYLAPSPGTY